MDRREAAVAVPTQVVEIVRPAKARVTEDQLPGIAAGRQGGRLEDLPDNRLIWTNDNLVALQTYAFTGARRARIPPGIASGAAVRAQQRQIGLKRGEGA